eukprot:Nitzschia sp. Nitz4//scaffold532_size3572//335//1557//NITZ4_009263-RA/size3572-snap-gene-0.2-mRNA-1//1//CDS//3329554116//3268//frame0
MSALLRGEYTGSMLQSDQISSSDSISLSIVVSHCEKPVGWIADYVGLGDGSSLPAQTQVGNVILQDVTIVSKCGQEVVAGAIPGSRVMRSFVRKLDAQCVKKVPFVLKDELNSVVLFMKDNSYRMNSTEYRSLKDVLDIIRGSGFACIEAPSRARSWQTSIYHNFYSMITYYRTQYYGTDPGAFKANIKGIQQKSPFLVANLSTFNEWVDTMGIFEPIMRSSIMYSHSLNASYPLMPVCYGGIFGTSLFQILQNDVTIYNDVVHSLSRADNILEGHFAERSWAALLSHVPHPSLLTAQEVLKAKRRQERHSDSIVLEDVLALRSDTIAFEELFAPGVLREVRTRSELENGPCNGKTPKPRRCETLKPCDKNSLFGKCGVLGIRNSDLQDVFHHQPNNMT